MAVTNFTKFFEKERDIYIQNKSGRLISLEFTLDSGVVVSHRLAKTPDPCNLTQFVPFSAIKNSIDLRNFANRQPPAIVFMEEEDYLAYFENRAKAHKSSIEEEIARANEKQRAVVNRTESKVVDEHKTLDEKRMELEAKGEPEPEVNPVVQGLCLKVGKDLKPEEIMPAREMLEELESLESNLKPIDYEYVFTHGYHKSIKKWAEKRMSEV